MEFAEFKKNIIGDEIYPIFNAYGKKVLYADWAASGRLYWEIEKKILEKPRGIAITNLKMKETRRINNVRYN